MNLCLIHGQKNNKWQKKEGYMFEKQGSPQPMSVVNKCCVCERPASVTKDGKLYCSECSPAILNLNDSQTIEDIIS
jgi:hypothetical protein